MTFNQSKSAFLRPRATVTSKMLGREEWTAAEHEQGILLMAQIQSIRIWGGKCL